MPKKSTPFSQFFKAVSVLLLALVIPVLNLGPSRPAHASSQENAKLPVDVSQSMALLVDVAQTKQAITIEELSPLLDFIRNTALTRDGWEVENLHGATSAYFGYTIAAPVEKIVSYLYHQGLPPSLFHPSVVHISSWKQKPNENIPLIWESLQDQEVRAIHGLEMEENTPDVNTGGYYNYENERMLLVLKHDGEKYIISVSKQTGQSSVGRKGVVLGDDSDWNYYYSDEQGLTKSGLGWVNSYIFDSFSVTVLSASQTKPGQSQHVMFKWVRAGWSGMNIVRTGHIRDGCGRFAQSLAKLMESDWLPDIQTIAAMADHVRSLDQAELERALEPFVQALRKLSGDDPVLSRRSFRDAVEDKPLEHYPLEAKQRLVMKEYLKASIGMPALLAMSDDLSPPFVRYASQRLFPTNSHTQKRAEELLSTIRPRCPTNPCR